MADLNELIDKTHFDYEKNEETARQLEERILKDLSIRSIFSEFYFLESAKNVFLREFR